MMSATASNLKAIRSEYLKRVTSSLAPELGAGERDIDTLADKAMSRLFRSRAAARVALAVSPSVHRAYVREQGCWMDVRWHAAIAAAYDALELSS